MNPCRRVLLLLLALPLLLLSLVAVLAWTSDGRARAAGDDPRFAGMVDVPEGAFKMGVDSKYFVNTFMKPKRYIMPMLLGNKKEVWWPILMWETSEHRAETEAYSIDIYEVTNAQYLAYLDDCCRTSIFTTKEKNSIYHVATQVFGKNPSEWQMNTVYLLNEKRLKTIEDQVLADNEQRVKAALEKFNRGMPPAGQVKKFQDLPPRHRLDAWAVFRLPEGTAVTAYSRTIPRSWKNGVPDQKLLPLPVRGVTAFDADAFAEWAGKHVPTEEEWEKAARGPKETLYPWGDTWDCKKDNNRILWVGSDSPPAPLTKDGPIAVNTMPEGKSGYGCYHMLGNLAEWTSGSPRKYPGTESKWPYYGEARIRAVRGGSFGSGQSYENRELSLRATTRMLEGPDGPVPPGNRYSSIGFRCARYPTPARDCLMHRLRRAGPLLPKTIGINPALAFGAELLAQAAPGEEGEGFVFVTGETRFIGLAPVDRLPFPVARNLIDHSRKAAGNPDLDPVIFAYLQWNGDMQVQAYVVEQPEAPVDEPDDGDEPDDEGKGKEKESPPVGPAVEKQVMLPAHKEGYLVGLHAGRLALFGLKLGGVRHVAYLTPLEQGEDPNVVEKVRAKVGNRQALLVTAKNRLEVRLPMLTRSKTSKDVFLVKFDLKLSDIPSGSWRDTPQGE